MDFRSKEQQEYHDLIANYFASSGGLPLLLHADAGLGKTRAFLHAALTNPRGRVLIATATTQLIRQLLDSDDLALTRGGLTIEPYISQMQYISPSRADKEFGIQCEAGEFVSDVLEREGRDIDPMSICVTSKCPKEERQHYVDQKAKAAGADVVIATHAALLLDVRTGGMLIGLSEFSRVVIDEADRLPAAAALQQEARVPLSTLGDLGINTKQDFTPLIAASVVRLDELIAAETDVFKRDEMRALKGTLADMLAANASDDLHNGATKTKDALVLEVRSPGRFVSRALHELRHCVLTSGTLAVKKSFRSAQSALNIKQPHPLSQIISPKRHGSVTFFVGDRRLDVDTDEWVDYVAKAVRVAQEDGDNILVLTTSYKLTEQLERLVSGVTAQRRGEPLSRLLKRFSGGVLISPAAWEGVDMPFQWSDVFIPRIPFPPPKETIDIHFLSAQDTAARRLTQGVARGLRNPNAAVRAWLLDPRFPIPSKLVNTGVATQGQAKNNAALIESIPERFRQGLFQSWDNGKIFRNS